MPAMQKLTIKDLRDQTYNEISGIFQESSPFTFNLSSPELLDLIIWNVVISFIVGVASNAAYSYLREILASKGKLTSEDLAEYKEIIEKEEIIIEQNHKIDSDLFVDNLELNVDQRAIHEVETKINKIMQKHCRTILKKRN